MARLRLPQFKLDDSVSEVWRWTIALAILMILFFAFAYRVVGLQQRAEQNTATQVTQGTEDQQLFFDLIRTGLLRPREDGGLEQAEADYLLVQQVEGNEPPEGVTRAEQERLLGALYASSVGVIVRQQVRLWNESRRISAIRDNRPRRDEESARARWTAFSPTDHPLRTGNLVPETFGFIHGGDLRAGFTDWITVPTTEEPTTFRTTVTVSEPRNITIQVIGNPTAIPDGASVRRLEAPEHLIRNRPCDTVPQAAIITVPVRGTRQLSVTVEPAINCAPRVFGLAIRLQPAEEAQAANGEDEERTDPATEDPQQQTDARGEDQVNRARAEDDGQGEQAMAAAAVAEGWEYRWRPVPRSSASEGRFTIYTSDGIALTDPSGSGDPTEAAEDLGLLNLVGFGPADSASLIGMLRRSRLPADNLEIRLTIDSHIQQAAQASMNHWMEVWSSDRFGEERKGAVVVLDADTGAILAVANHPLPPNDARPWDYAAFAYTNPLRDPMSIFGWEVSDKHNTPGSTFKPLVALALIQSDDPTIQRLVRGVDPVTFTRLMGFGPNAGAYYPGGGRRGVPNFGGTGMTGYFNAASRHPACLQAGFAPEFRRFAEGGQNQFGVTQAVQGSFNVWFARMAVMLDEPTIREWVASLPTSNGWTLGPSSPPQTRLIQSVEQFGIDPENRIDLAANLPESAGLFRLNTDTGADILYSALPASVITNVEYPRAQPGDITALTLFMVAQNGFGQSWSVTPLHMARATAGISSGRLVRPHIFAGWAGRELSPPDAEPLRGGETELDLLREGMKAVAEASRSTAGSIFGSAGEIEQWRQRTGSQATRDELLQIRCRVYGKTGTADISRQEGYNSGWFIGWLEPLRQGGRRLAFACMTTHAIGRLRFGGSSCGRIVRDMLLGIEQNAVQEARRAEEEAERQREAQEERERQEQAQREQERQQNEGQEQQQREEGEQRPQGEGSNGGSELLPELPPDEDPGNDNPRNNP